MPWAIFFIKINNNNNNNNNNNFNINSFLSPRTSHVHCVQRLIITTTITRDSCHIYDRVLCKIINCCDRELHARCLAEVLNIPLNSLFVLTYWSWKSKEILKNLKKNLQKFSSLAINFTAIFKQLSMVVSKLNAWIYFCVFRECWPKLAKISSDKRLVIRRLLNINLDEIIQAKTFILISILHNILLKPLHGSSE